MNETSVLKTDASNSPSNPRGQSSELLRALLGVLALVGLGVSIYLTFFHFRVLTDPAFESACKFNETMDCDKVNSSMYAKVWGIPLAWYGAAYYLAMALVAGLSFVKGERFERAVELIFGFSFLSSLLSIGLAVISATEIGAFCLFCITLYVVNFGMLGVSYVGAGGGIRSIIGRLDKELIGFYRSPIMYTVGLVFFGTVLIGGGYYKEQVRVNEQANVEKFLQDKEREIKKPAAQVDEHGDHAHAKEGAKDGASAGAKTSPAAPSTDAQETPVAFKRLGHEPVRGKDGAPVMISIFSDFQCPYCQMAGTVLDEVVHQNPGKVGVVYYQYPLDMECNPYMQRPLHEFGCRASVAAICAGKQGQFWEMHDLLFRNQPGINPESITQHARTLGMDMTAFETCQQDRSNYIQINQDIEMGKAAEITGTPALFINGRRWKGALTVEALSAVVNQLAVLP